MWGRTADSTHPPGVSPRFTTRNGPAAAPPFTNSDQLPPHSLPEQTLNFQILILGPHFSQRSVARICACLSVSVTFFVCLYLSVTSS